MTLRTTTGHCSREQLAARVAYYGGRCHICREAANEIDHVKPVAAGGSNWPANLRPICGRCNRSKGATWRDVYGHHAPLVLSDVKVA
jgi:5-methylcytosine-specific restriction endonuclease McrA